MAVLRYTALRLLVLGAVAALLWLLGLRGLGLVFVAVFVSGLLSIFVLNRSREQFSAALDRRLSTIKERAAAEDAWDDARRDQEAAGEQEAADEGEVAGEREVAGEPDERRRSAPE
ncbi:uncharacterized protein DUF4229 [Haloactinopolyspora alba]|uniref:Uncharacterized protein DUF4229 n=1 Tax=Haloactinopolyspora alba TaxID=648780 RepID=A0A2P8DGL8_9ACTN|nr:DUF4229 domain-containing protein [Haloactinopolyspora alba]PSK96374.1 uncharacterized protein DUF4229 [Haloactinopolyspora alba]